MYSLEIKKRQVLEQMAEVKRSLRALENALKNNIPATVLITSANQGEGKSLFTATIAAAAAQSGKYRVAVLDLNWYRPALHAYYGIEQSHSLGEILKAEIGDLVRPSGRHALDILTAPYDFADSASQSDLVGRIPDRLIGQARKTYDLILIDSAAVFPTNRMMMDPVMLSGLVDGTLMVILTAATPKQQVRKAHKLLETAGAHLLGVIGNQGQAAAK